MASTETRARGRIKTALEGDGRYVVTLHGDATSGRGRSDLIICAAGVYFWLEVKTLDGSPSPAQLRRIREVRLAGGIACIVTSIYEARWVIETRLKGYVPYMAEEVQAKQTLDLSQFARVEVPPDPDAIPFPDPPKVDPMALQPGEVAVDVVITKVPDHIVVGTGEIIEPEDVKDDEVDTLLQQVQGRIAEREIAVPLPTPAPEVEAPSAPRRRASRAKAKEEPAAEQPPLPPTLTDAQAAAPAGWDPSLFTTPPAVSEAAGEGQLDLLYAKLLETWDVVNRIEQQLVTQTSMLEKFLYPDGSPT